MRTSIVTAAGILILLGAGGTAFAQPSPTMCTLDQIYYYLVEGTEAAWGAHSLEPRSGVPGGTVPGYGKSLGDIYDDIRAEFSRCGASAAEVNAGKLFFSTQTDSWGVQTGTAGYLLRTGQTTSYRVGDDGYYQKGDAFSYQTLDPAGNGEIVTVDNVTGLMWATDGNGAGCNFGGGLNWNDSIDWAEGLTFAGYSDWRLPNIVELQTLFVLEAGGGSPYINQTYFPNSYFAYRSSTTRTGNQSYALMAIFGHGGTVGSSHKNQMGPFRVVRGGL